MLRYDLQDLGVAAVIGALGLLVGVAGGSTVTEHRYAAQALESAAGMSALERGCDVLPAIDSRIAVGAERGQANVGYTSGCSSHGPVSLTLLDPAERPFRSVQLDGWSGVNGAAVPLTDDVPLGRWTLRVDAPDHARTAVVEVKRASRLRWSAATGSADVSVYDPVTHGFRPWATTVELQRLTDAGWRRAGGGRSGEDGVAAVAPPRGPGRYRLVTFDTGAAFGSQAPVQPAQTVQAVAGLAAAR